MHPSFNPGRGAVVDHVPRMATGLMLLALGFWAIAELARMMPGMVRNLARPCVGCYLGPFEPPLEPFRMPARRSQVAIAVEATLPVLTTVQTSVIDTESIQLGDAGGWLGPSDLLAAQLVSLFGFDRTSSDAALSFVRNDAVMMCRCSASAEAWTFTGEPDPTGHEARKDDKTARITWTGVPVDGFTDGNLNVSYLSEAATLAGTWLVPIFISPDAPWYDLQPTRASDIEAGIVMCRMRGSPG